MTENITVKQWRNRKNVYRVDATEEVHEQCYDIIEVGTEVVVYSDQEPSRGVVLAGPNYDFLHTSPAYEVEIDGMVHRCSHSIVVDADDFGDAYHLWDDDIIIAGGPGMNPDNLRRFSDEVKDTYPNAVLKRGW